MIANGTKPTKRDHRDYSFHRTFGSTTEIPDEFDLDLGLTMPDQREDGLPMGCTGYTLAEICQDRDRVVYKPGFSYEKTQIIEGIKPNDPQFGKVGCSIRNSLKSGIMYGVQRDTETTDEDAFRHRIGDYYDVLNGSGLDCFDSIRSAMWQGNKSVYVGTPWLIGWSNPQNGIIPSFVTKPNSSTSWHAWKISGTKKIDGQIYLKGKTWQGKGYGDQGWAYFSRNVINKVLTIKGTCAFALIPFSGQSIAKVNLDIVETVASYLRLLVKRLNPSRTFAPTPIFRRRSTD